MSASREQFSSRIGFILATAGSAVGIGNMVGFPVAATKNGGGAFLLVYAIFVFFICLPVMMAEMAMGRNSRKDPLGAYREMSGNDPKWTFAGKVGLITPFMIAVFYLVITVWIFGYLVQAAMGDLDKLADPNTFGTFVNSKEVFLYLILVCTVIFGILRGGVKEGIEKAAKIMMPALFVMLVGMVIFVLTLDNAFAGVEYYLIPDFSKINASVVSAALSQAFFSLSLGMGILITYGSYLNSKDDIASSSKFVALTDTAVAFTAGLMIIPAIFSLNPNTNTDELSDSTVSLIFSFLPKIFLALQATIGYVGASIVASVFFLLVFFAAITSIVSIIEVPVASFMDSNNRSRRKAVALIGGGVAVVGAMAALSFGMVDFFTNFVSYAGASQSFFQVVVDVFYDTILPFNGLMVCLFVVYRWKKSSFHEELAKGDGHAADAWYTKYVDISLGTFIPVILALIFINTVALKFFGYSFV